MNISKYISSFLGAMAIAIVPATAETLYVQDKVLPDTQETSLTVNLEKTTDYISCQYDIYLPTGVSYALDNDGNPIVSINAARVKDHTVTAKLQSDGSLRCMVVSLTNSLLVGESGEFMTVQVQPKSNFTGDHAGYVQNVKFCTPSFERVVFDNTKYTLTGPKPSAPNVKDCVTIDNVSAEIGTTIALSVNLKKTIGYTDVEFDVQLPEGVTLDSDNENEIPATLNDERNGGDHVLTSRMNDDGTLHFWVTSAAGNTIQGSSGQLLSLNVLLADSEDYIGENQGIVQNALGCSKDYADKSFASTIFTITGTAHATPAEPAEPDTQDLLYGVESIVKTGDVSTITLNLDNETEYISCMFDVVLPDGLTFVCDDDGASEAELCSSRNGKDHVISSNLQSDGSMKYIIVSMSNRKFQGNEGAFMTFNVQAADGFVGETVGEVKNVRFTTTDFEGYNFADTKFKIVGDENASSDDHEVSKTIHKLSILDSNGMITIDVEDGQSFDCTITANENWSVSGVFVNNIDKTIDIAADGSFSTGAITEDTNISVVYKQVISTSVMAKSLSNVSILPVADGVYVEGAQDDSNVIVTDVNGVNVYCGRDKFISLCKNGIYILNVEGQVFKFIH